MIDYRITFAEPGDPFVEHGVTTARTYLVDGLTAGTVYQFKIEARNIYDYSLPSQELTLTCSWIPEAPTSVITLINFGTL